MRTNRATLSDEGLTNAFKEGFEEGLGLAGSDVVFTFKLSTDGVDIALVRTKDVDEVLGRVKHYLSENNVGVVMTVTIEAGGKVLPENSDADIIDAEVVEEPPS